MTRVCVPIALNCDYCYTLELAYETILNVAAGLTPAASLYVWVTNKFGNQYVDAITVNGDGSFNIDTSNYPAGMFNPLAGWFDVFVTSDVDGNTVVPMSFGPDEYNCLKLATFCSDPWILRTGFWDDDGIWVDTAVWID